LDSVVPFKQLDRNLLIASWNIRAFGDLTEKWRTDEGDSPKRDLHALRCITEVVSRFDVVAIQEVRDNIKSLRHMLKVLGTDWGLILTDVTKGRAGNDERMAFVFDTRRVRPSGLACELVVPDEWVERGVEENALQRQFARTPYAVSFLASGHTFILVTLHVIFGHKAEDRVTELNWIAQWLANWAEQEDEWGHNLIALGDFNIDRKGDPNYEAFTSSGLRIPEKLGGLPRTIFDEPQTPHNYDQIAWFTGEQEVPMLSLPFTGQAGNFDFVGVVLGDLNRTELSWRISDHYPMWAEFWTGPGQQEGPT
jgi:endonuclease/exonuclease/phosphatase family metal-dependent hydrolase